MPKAKILIVEDDRDIAEMVAYNLTEEGYEAISAFDGRNAVEMARRNRPDLIILDLMLPGLDGFEICKILRSERRTANVPIIILSAKSRETDKVLGLELGADDYVTKPFSPRELIARIRAVLRRGRAPESHDRLQTGDIVIDRTAHRVTAAGAEIDLTNTEFKLLECLARRPGAVLSRDMILDLLCGDRAVVCDRTVDAHIKSLRRKLGKARDRIETVRGVGYRFTDV